MSLLSNNKKDNKKGAKNTKAGVQGGKIAQQTKATGFAKKPVKTGGSRGS
jgi:hypothetical protein